MARGRRRQRRGGIAIGQSFGGFAILAIGILLFALSWPRLYSALASSPGTAVIERLKTDQPVGDIGLEKAAASFRAGQRAFPSGYAAPRDLALIELIQAKRAEDNPQQRIKHLNAAIVASKQSLANNPAQPYVWLRLSQAQLQTVGVGAEAALSFTMSLETGPQVIDLMQTRVVLGLILWPVLDDVQRNRVLAQIRGLARYNPRILAETVLNRPGLPQVRRALENEPELESAFLRWYLQRRTPGIRLPTR